MTDKAASEAIKRQFLPEKAELAEEPNQLNVPEKWR
jgi:hypothetical protein